MIVARSLAELRASLVGCERPVGLVPTMGALHAGHRALIDAARAECATVVVSIFVNPLQFGPNEDFARYPRAFDGDVELARHAGADIIFAPSVAEMLPAGFAASVDPGPIGAVFEGVLRPGHFTGVATICVRLWGLVGCERTYFGAKDAQQVAVLRSVIRDLALHVAFMVMPTVREADGLALSSRNVYLSADERSRAVVLSAALAAMRDAVAAGVRSHDDVIAAGVALIQGHAEAVYLALVDPASFAVRSVIERSDASLAIGSIRFGTTRLLDNLAVGAA